MNTDEDFWEDLLFGQQSVTASSLDAHLQGREAELAHTGMRVLTDQGRAAAALSLPVEAGTRVAFVTNLGSVLAYEHPPTDSVGTVVMVRTADGDTTSVGERVFVKFDGGQFLAIHQEHLRRTTASKLAGNFTRRVSNLGDLSGFLHWGEGENDLVHKATRDLWSFETTQDGDYVLSRLFNDSGSPLKV